MSSPTDAAAALRDALAARGLHVRVEGADSLAILVPPPGAALDWPAERHEIVRLARAHGFSHVALELPPPDGAGE